MTNPFRKKLTPRLSEIHEYTLDLQRISLLRDKCEDPKERETYDAAIHIMQEVLIFLNTKVIE